MTFLLDENVQRAVGMYLADHGFDVQLVADVLVRGTPDYVVADYAHANRLIILTHNRKDFVRIMNTRGTPRARKRPDAGYIGLDCPEEEAVNRIDAVFDLIQHELRTCATSNRAITATVGAWGMHVDR